MYLGTKPTDTEGIPESPSDIRYPGFTLSNDLVDQLTDECPCEVGDTITATVKLKVTGMSDQEFGKSLSLDVLSMKVDGEPEKAESDESEESDGENSEKPSGKKPRNPAVAKLVEKD